MEQGKEVSEKTTGLKEQPDAIKLEDMEPVKLPEKPVSTNPLAEKEAYNKAMIEKAHKGRTKCYLCGAASGLYYKDNGKGVTLKRLAEDKYICMRCVNEKANSKRG